MTATIRRRRRSCPAGRRGRRSCPPRRSTDPSGVDSPEARESRQEFTDAAVAAGLPDPRLAADVLFLVPRGCFASTVEEPAYWTEERTSLVARAVVKALTEG